LTNTRKGQSWAFVSEGAPILGVQKFFWAVREGQRLRVDARFGMGKGSFAVGQGLLRRARNIIICCSGPALD